MNCQSGIIFLYVNNYTTTKIQKHFCYIFFDWCVDNSLYKLLTLYSYYKNIYKNIKAKKSADTESQLTI